jgi:hypothetical protein
VNGPFGLGVPRRLRVSLGHPFEESADHHAEGEAEEGPEVLIHTAPAVAVAGPRARGAMAACVRGWRDAHPSRQAHERGREDDCQETMHHVAAVQAP